MRIRTEVKCYRCSRVCGEIEGSPPRVWVLYRAKRLLPGTRCGVTSLTDLRCSRCGGRMYPDETYTLAGARASQAA